jgi:hypothetical protein
LLIATHLDRLQGESDAGKVLARLRRETSGYFREALLISTATPALWQARGRPLLASSLTPILAAIEARRHQQASQAARRIATAALDRLGNADRAEDPAEITAAWQALESDLTRKLAEQPLAGEAHLGEFAQALRHFADTTAGPCLRQNFGMQTSGQILELFRCEPALLKEIIGDLNGGAAPVVLRAVLQQLGEELAETLDRVPAPRPAPGRLPEERRLALEMLFALSGAS